MMYYWYQNMMTRPLLRLTTYCDNETYINCGVYGKGRIYHLEYTKLADSERGRL